MNAEAKFSEQTIIGWQSWAPHLFSFKITRPKELDFKPGQFVRLGLPKENGEEIWRAYSFVSSPTDEHLEFYSIVAPDGEFSPRLARMKLGDTLWVHHTAYGFLTLDRFTDGTTDTVGKDLWMLATGTGLAPFVSILRDPECWQKFEKLILVHSVRYAHELAYRSLLCHFEHPDIDPALVKKLVYCPTITRRQDTQDISPNTYDTHNKDTALVLETNSKRITTLIQTDTLASWVNIPMDPVSSRIMVCGNPAMVKETRLLLTERGYAVSRTAAPGPLVLENQW